MKVHLQRIRLCQGIAVLGSSSRGAGHQCRLAARPTWLIPIRLEVPDGPSRAGMAGGSGGGTGRCSDRGEPGHTRGGLKKVSAGHPAWRCDPVSRCVESFHVSKIPGRISTEKTRALGETRPLRKPSQVPRISADGTRRRSASDATLRTECRPMSVCVDGCLVIREDRAVAGCHRQTVSHPFERETLGSSARMINGSSRPMVIGDGTQPAPQQVDRLASRSRLVTGVHDWCGSRSRIAPKRKVDLCPSEFLRSCYW